MNQRRYDDDEVREILGRATESPDGPVAGNSPALQGLSLAELQEIGEEVGIPPARIAQAARALDRPKEIQPAVSFLGAPRSVSRAIPLSRSLTDQEWDRLVADLRNTFKAKGKVSVQGGLRSWSNGNLHAHVEPTRDGWRLRMETFKGDVGSWAVLGGMSAAVGTLLVALGTVGGMELKEMVVGVAFLGVGAGNLGYARLRLPSWAGRRARQMEGVAERTALLLESGDADAGDQGR